MDNKFYIKIDDISKVAGRVVISGEANRSFYTGKLNDSIDAFGILTEPVHLNKAFLSVFGKNVSKLKVGDVLYGE